MGARIIEEVVQMQGEWQHLGKILFATDFTDSHRGFLNSVQIGVIRG